MDLRFGNTGQNLFGAVQQAQGTNAQAQRGPDLEDIQTEEIGFLSLAGESKLRLLPKPWPSDQLPPPTSSLMSVASQRGIIAAAGPDVVIIAATDSVRNAFETPKSGESDIRPFQPQLTIPMTIRISQVAFTADESVLVLSAETGGGLACYEVQSLLNGSTQPAFQMATNSLALRALVPNPTPEKAELLAAVTTDGNFMMVNLKEKNLVSGGDGPVLKNSVSCVSWSVKGKQLVAGLVDGTAYQMTPEGETKAIIPRPPSIDTSCHMSSIIWLENNLFLMVHTPSNFDTGSPSPSTFHIATRSSQSPSEFSFQNIPDPAEPFGLDRSPPHHFSIRLKDFPPNLQDLIIVASTASTDIGLFTRSKTPLTTDKPADKITGVFTMTGMADDSRRAQLSMTEDMSDTSPIGLVLDLSSQGKVPRPMPKEDIDQSSTPIPGVMLLNNEGILAYWWVIYSESIISGTIYPGLIAAGSVQQPAQPTPTKQTGSFGSTALQPVFSQQAFGAASNPSPAFATLKPAISAFGSPSAPGGSTPGAFGAPSGLNKAPSVWGMAASRNASITGTTFGAPTFGSTSAPGAGTLTFGSSALPGSRASPWASGSIKPMGSTFSQTGGHGEPAGSSQFGSTANSGTFGAGGKPTMTSSGGFASFARESGFAAAPKGSGESIFASKSDGNAFSAAASIHGRGASSSFGGISVDESGKSHELFGLKDFTLNSTFKPDESAKDDGPRLPNDSGSSFFGSSIGQALTEGHKVSATATPAEIEADMDAEDPDSLPGSIKEDLQSEPKPVFSVPAAASTTPSSTPMAFKSPAFAGELLGSPGSEQPLFSTAGASKSSGFSFENIPAQLAKTDAQSEVPLTSNTLFTPMVPKIKSEPLLDDEVESVIQHIPEAPLPPDPTSKSTYSLGGSSASSAEPDALSIAAFIKTETLMPPVILQSSSLESQLSSEQPDGPAEEFEDSEDYVTEDEDDERPSQPHSPIGDDSGNDEGSGEDVTKDLSTASGSNVTLGFTPQSSFRMPGDRGDVESLFSKVSKPQPNTSSRSLFGEIHNNAAPILPPPKANLSPRSPSPVRTTVPGRLRADISRSVSAPGVASQLLGPQNLMLSRPVVSSSNSSSLALGQRKVEERQNAENKLRKEAEESQALIDQEDESVQRFLQQETVGTKKLDDFIAHQDYVTKKDKNSIPSQVEAVYRDINSMIDTLGINSCSLKSFIKGHSERRDSYVRTREDLDGDEEWLMVEIETLSTVIEEDLSAELEEGRVKDLAGKLDACRALEREIGKLRSKHDDIKTLVVSQFDQDHLTVIRSRPLSAEQATQQHDLRKNFTKFQKLLNEAEEDLTMLRAQMASQSRRNGKSNSGPTVEAVMRTIVKMTNMAEKRSGDIDVLENQMRKLRVSSTASDASREGSPFATPAKSIMRNSGMSSTNSLFYSPDSVKGSHHEPRNSITSPEYSFRGTPPRKKLSGFTAEDRVRVKAKLSKRKEITDKLKVAFLSSATRVYGYDA